MTIKVNDKKRDARTKLKNKGDPAGKVCLLGAHFSIAGGLQNALYEAKAYDCNVLQIFTKNASTWKERMLTSEEAATFKKARSETGVKSIASHTSYLINLAAPDRKKHAMSCRALEQELARSLQLEIPFVVLHPGSHMGKGDRAGIQRIADSVNEIFRNNPTGKTRLLFETTAGQGTSIGHRFEALAALKDRIKEPEGIGFCLDTCHIFAAGYDLRTEKACRQTVDIFEKIVGLAHLYVIHLNDSKKDLGSRVDRHAHIGEGLIGLKAFEFFMNDKRFEKIPKIIETPKHKDDRDGDRVNLRTLRTLWQG